MQGEGNEESEAIEMHIHTTTTFFLENKSSNIDHSIASDAGIGLSGVPSV